MSEHYGWSARNDAYSVADIDSRPRRREKRLGPDANLLKRADALSFRHAEGVWTGSESGSGGVAVGTDQELYAAYQTICGPGDNALAAS